MVNVLVAPVSCQGQYVYGNSSHWSVCDDDGLLGEVFKQTE